MSQEAADVIGTLAGLTPGSALDTLRDRRPQARTHSQLSYNALFAPEDPGGVSLPERFAVAAFVAGLHQDAAAAGHYGDALAGSGAPPGWRASIAEAAASAAGHGPYGAYPPGTLSAEDEAGPDLHLDGAAVSGLGAKLAAALDHAHMLVFHPRDADAVRLQRLLDAGWGTTDIVTLSQLVAFLAYQIRVAAGLRTLAHHPRPEQG